MISKIKKYGQPYQTECLFWLGVYVLMCFSLVALGAKSIVVIPSLHKIFYILYAATPMLIFFFLIFQISKKLFKLLLIVFTIISTMFLPQSIIYGNLDYGMFVSALETNTNESFEYIINLPKIIYLFVLSYILFTIFILIKTKKIQKISLLKRVYIGLICYIGLIFCGNSISHYIKFKEIILNLQNNHIYILSLYKTFSAYYLDYTKNQIFLEKSQHEPPTWKILSTQPKYKIFVLIIGESVRKEYMNLYNYPIQNTPFLSNVKGIVFNNYISAGSHTQLSLQNTLYLKDNQQNPIFTNHIINLAKNGGFNIYWISNQGQRGRADSMATRVAMQAHQQIFLSEFFKATTFDDQLLPYIQKAIQEPTSQPKLIVVHLMGSHPDFCQRLKHKPSYQLINKNMSCYLETILQTDNLIRNINIMLQKKNESYSVMYFADHGLSHHKVGQYLAHDANYKQSYHVPLIQFSSDDTQRIYINAQKSGYDLINGIAEWLGIQEEILSQKTSFYSNQPSNRIKLFNSQDKVIFYDELENNPTLPPIPY